MSSKVFHLKLRFSIYRDEADDYFDGDHPVMCKSFVYKHILGKSPEFIKLWVISEETGNVEFHHLGFCASFEGDDFQHVYPELTKAWEELGKPEKISIYAQQITEKEYLDKE